MQVTIKLGSLYLYIFLYDKHTLLSTCLASASTLTDIVVSWIRTRIGLECGIIHCTTIVQYLLVYRISLSLSLLYVCMYIYIYIYIWRN